MNTKGSRVSFQDSLKETFTTRLKKLIGREPVRSVAQRWDIPYSTLNNYLHRGNEPALSVVARIASIEGVSVEWLAGLSDSVECGSDCAISDSAMQQPADNVRTTWTKICNSLNENDISILMDFFFQYGIRGITSISKEFSAETVQQFIQLSEAEREQVLRLFEQVKKGTDQGRQIDTESGPETKHSGAA